MLENERKLLLDAVLESYLDNLTEREFDAPFLSLLRAHGYFDIHFLHGAFEWGKDFIAKAIDNGTTVQYAFQTKGGDLGLADWRAIRGQVDDLRSNTLGHPNFDAAAPRRAVLVTTGRLVGAAGTSAGEYASLLRSRGEETFEVWDRERLVELIAAVPETGLPRSTEAALGRVLSDVDAGRIDDRAVEEFSRRWILPIGTTATLRLASLEAAVIANRLRRSGRLDLAAITALCLIRGAWASSGNLEPAPDGVMESADVGRSLFIGYAAELRQLCDTQSLDPKEFAQAHWPSKLYLSYPVRCLRLGELLGLLALAPGVDPAEAREVSEFLCQFAS
ncbi:MAG: hypothetical protein ACYDAN_12985, partial [Candidatus Limnocylindrales bacterium]